jgi:hypothetical protein
MSQFFRLDFIACQRAMVSLASEVEGDADCEATAGTGYCGSSA